MRQIRTGVAAGCVSAGIVAVIGIIAVAGPQATQEPAGEPVSVRYSRSCLKLAGIELQQLLDQNHKAPGVIPDMVLERARMNVKVAQAQLEHALAPTSAGTAAVQVRYAEERVKLAEIELEKAKRVRRHDPDAMSELELERLSLVAEVARLRLAMWRDPVYLPSLLDQMQWQLDRLSEEVIEISKKVE